MKTQSQHNVELRDLVARFPAPWVHDDKLKIIRDAKGSMVPIAVDFSGPGATMAARDMMRAGLVAAVNLAAGLTP